MQKQEISLHTPHPNPAKYSYESIGRGLPKFPPPLMGGGEGEGDAYAFIRIMSIYLTRLL